MTYDVFHGILRLTPKADPAGLNDMENKLSKRFAGVAKKFGVGLKRAILGGGVTALALGVINKILNPLQETQAALDRILGQTDDVVTAAKQFETTSGKYFKLQQLAQYSGIDEGSLQLQLTKFQTALAEERAKKPGEEKGTLQNFTGFTDTVDAFVAFSESLKTMKPDDRILIQKEIFGEKAIGKMSDFLNLDFQKVLKSMGAENSSVYTKAFETLNPIKELDKSLAGSRNFGDVVTKANTIKPDFIKANNELELLKLDKENKNLSNYKNLMEMAKAGEKMQQKLDAIFAWLSTFTPGANTFMDQVVTDSKYIGGKVGSIFDFIQKHGKKRNTQVIRTHPGL
jgi:hypothetical protein